MHVQDILIHHIDTSARESGTPPAPGCLETSAGRARPADAPTFSWRGVLVGVQWGWEMMQEWHTVETLISQLWRQTCRMNGKQWDQLESIPSIQVRPGKSRQIPGHDSPEGAWQRGCRLAWPTCMVHVHVHVPSTQQTRDRRPSERPPDNSYDCAPLFRYSYMRGSRTSTLPA